MGKSAKVGNFVELKKTRVGKGSKVPHLSYVGDTTIGDDANIGAGTITCNYDGSEKHETKIGDRVFVGTNSSLVAPLTIGEGAYIAAGSTITENVLPGAGRGTSETGDQRRMGCPQKKNQETTQAGRKGLEERHSWRT